MIFEQLLLPGAYIIRLKKFENDHRFFARNGCRREFEAHGLAGGMVKADMAYRHHHGILRGIHYQQNPHAEIKLFSFSAFSGSAGELPPTS